MNLMEWTPALSVGIAAIDEQHKKLLGYMNTLYDSLLQKKEKEILSQLFLDLENYTHTHFTMEEQYFKNFDYPEKDEHIKQHHEFITNLAKLKNQIQNETDDTDNLLAFLVDWLIHHIKIVDHRYVDCFHEHNIK